MNTETLDKLVAFAACVVVDWPQDYTRQTESSGSKSAWQTVSITLGQMSNADRVEHIVGLMDAFADGSANEADDAEVYQDVLSTCANRYGIDIYVWDRCVAQRLHACRLGISEALDLSGADLVTNINNVTELREEIAGEVSMPVQTAEEYAAVTASTTTTEEVSMNMQDVFVGDKNVADSVLKGLTDGRLTMAVLEGLTVRASQAGTYEAEIKELKVLAASRPKVALPTKFEGVTGSELVGELSWCKASEVFGLKGKAKEVMTFDVPVWTWTNKNGEEMEHPEVPTVDDHYKFDGRLFEAIRAVMNKDFLWIWGHTGAGKSSLIEQIAARLKFPLVTVSMDGEITRMDLIGQTKLSEKAGVTITEFVEGVLPNAMSRPSILLMDEMDFVRGDVAYALQTVLNSKEGTLNLLEDGGRVVQRHPWSMICATANTNGRGDESGRYNYAKRQSSALLNRFTSWMKVDYLSKKDEVGLLKRVVPELSAEEVEQLCTYAKEHRTAFLKDDIEMAMSLRNLVALGQKYIDYKVWLGDDTKAMAQAFENTITNAASEDDAIAINGIRQRVIGV